MPAPGLNWNLSFGLPGYPATTYTAHLYMRGPVFVDLTCSAGVDPLSHYLTLTGAESAAKFTRSGDFEYSLQVSDAHGNVAELERGLTVVPANLSAGPIISHAQKVLDAIEAVLEKRATLDQQRYSIADRELVRTPIPELLLLRDRYRSEVRRERLSKRGALFGQKAQVWFR